MNSLLLDGPNEITPVWNSTFKIVEAPMSYMNKLLNVHGRWVDQLLFAFPVSGQEFGNAFNPLWSGLKNFNVTEIKSGSMAVGGTFQKVAGHFYSKKITILASVGQAVVFPITWVFTPITAIADIFAGIMQASLRAYQGASKAEVISILHKKVIAAPSQQLAYTVNNFVVFSPTFFQIAKGVVPRLLILGVVTIAINYFKGFSFSESCEIASVIPGAGLSAVIGYAPQIIMLHSLFLGDSLYRDAQSVVGKLPKFLIPEGYNIFIEGGALDPYGNNAFDPEAKYEEFKKKSHGPQPEPRSTSADYSESRLFSLDYREKLKKELDAIEEKDPALEGFYEWFEGNLEPYTLFGFSSPSEVTQRELTIAYHKLAKKCHSDKCKAKEADPIFKMVSTAREDVEERILKKKSTPTNS